MKVSCQVIHKLLERSPYRYVKTLFRGEPCWVLEREEYDARDNYDHIDLEAYQQDYLDAGLSDLEVAKQFVIDANRGDLDNPVGYFHDAVSGKSWNILVTNNPDGGVKLQYLYFFDNDAGDDGLAGVPTIVDDLNDLYYAKDLVLKYGALVI